MVLARNHQVSRQSLGGCGRENTSEGRSSNICLVAAGKVAGRVSVLGHAQTAGCHICRTHLRSNLAGPGKVSEIDRTAVYECLNWGGIFAEIRRKHVYRFA